MLAILLALTSLGLIGMHLCDIYLQSGRRSWCVPAVNARRIDN